MVTNAQGEIIVFNAKAEDLFGYNRTQVFGHKIEYLMPQRYHTIHTHHRADYMTHPSKRSMGKSKDLYAQRFLTDITERQQAEHEIKRLNDKLERQIQETETRYAQIVELAEEGIWVTDAQGNTTYTNQAMARMLGYTEAEILGHAIADFMTPGNNRFTTALTLSLNQNKVHRQEVELRTKTGSTIWAYMCRISQGDSVKR